LRQWLPALSPAASVGAIKTENDRVAADANDNIHDTAA
jgi:hypothetical protein